MQIEFRNVGYIYSQGTPFESQALQDVNFIIPDKSYTAIIGHTGSGKSTITKHFNALIKPTVGEIIVGETRITQESKASETKAVRQRIGMVFQFPESQLFEETILKDVMFGPMNFGHSEEEAKQKAVKALNQVGISEALFERSPFDLSGGQMRRVAIAGVLAMEPEVLVLDEPTAGLDPKGQKELMTIFYDLYQAENLTVILVTHQMNDVANFANHVIVMDKGTCVMEGTPEEIFSDADRLKSYQLGLPEALAFKQALVQQDSRFKDAELPLTVEALADYIARNQQKVSRNEVPNEG